MLQKLDSDFFIQAHRSYIVNKAFVTSISNETLILSNQTFIPIGQHYKKSLIDHIGG